MKYAAFIPHVNRMDLLEKAIKSLQYKTPIVLIDNSEKHELNPKVYKDLFGMEIITPLVPLSFTQTMNVIQNLAIERNLDFFVFMHSDAVAPKRRVESLFKTVEKAFKKEPKWGVVFTLYDCLCAYNTKAIQKIGKWDTNFPQYFADNDYFRRMRLKGYKTLESGNEGIGHVASATIKNDLDRFLANQIMYMNYRQLYANKWGGIPNQETYMIPYNKLEL